MANVNFQCGHCQQVMAVGEEFLGQQVRCPHCQQVVLAPPAAEAPAPTGPGPDEPDSIFAPPEGAGDDLFGAAEPPRVELPPAPALPPALDPVAPSVTEPPPVLTPAGDGVAFPVEVAPPGEEPAAPPVVVESRPRPSRGGGWVIAVVIVPLISYSILATIAIILLLSQIRNQPHPLEMVPDLEGDNKGGTGRGGGKHGSVDFSMPNPEQPLPARLRVPLGATLAVGDLAVTPRKVERRRLAWLVGQAHVPFPEEVLALTLTLRNRSADVAFRPMDRFFARSRPTRPGVLRQYTFLEMGDRKFYGGPLRWAPLTAKNGDNVEYVEGQKVNEELHPGEEMTTFVCTNPDDHAARALDNYRGPLLWRVQLRRGPVRWTTRDGVARADSATAVVGVEFAAADVKEAAN